MPKGRSKGFGHYMCKKFFHPGNPENLERVFIANSKVQVQYFKGQRMDPSLAREKVKQKAEQEEAKMREYEQEQERWNNRAMMAKADDKEKMALSFMYDPPPGHPKNKATQEAAANSEYDQNGKKKKDFKFEWQRQAPREAICKGDPNIIDQPFGIQVQFSKCIKCQVWGHSHTEKHCPKFGKARDADEEPSVIVDDKKLIEEMKMTDRLQFTSYGTWDNGKAKKHYSMVFSSDEDEEQLAAGGDIMVGLLKQIRTKKKRVTSDSKESTSKRTKKSAKNKKSEQSDATGTSSKKVCHSDSKKEGGSKKKKASRRDAKKKSRKKSKVKDSSVQLSSSLKSEYLDKIDDILFSDIKQEPRLEQAAQFLGQVDRILAANQHGGSKDDSESEESESSEDAASTSSSSTSSEELTESGNLIHQ